jgi:mono/diheme cytochrome c family protein
MRTAIASAFVALACLPGISGADDETFFRDKVAPILERNCLSCHQGDKPKGGLSLVSAKAAFAGADSGEVIEPGQPDASRLVDVISGDAPEMPPKGKPLSKDEVGIVRQWIAGGAKWPDDLALHDRKLAGADDDWWSLRPLTRPPVPEIKSDRIRTPVDAFILARLAEKKLVPAPEADRRTLIRRVAYDLHGLPPTPAEVDAFLQDTSHDAYERLVDRLLESPRYGERWGRHWLDIVHFGESHGYDKDKPRPNAWPYRDYLIAAFNADKPYSRFVAEQLAGDVLFPDDPQATVATGFIAAGPWDFVGHVELREGTLDKKITRSNDRDDMVATAMGTFVSLTVHCARCHNHKFDPIPQEDYYKLQAVFAGVDRADRPYDADAATYRTRQKLLTEREPLAARQKSLNDDIAKTTSPEIEQCDARLKDLSSQLASSPQPDKNAASPTNGYHSAIEKSPDVEKWVQVDLGRETPIEQIVLVPARPTDFRDTPGFGFPLRFRVELSNDAAFGEKQTIADHTAADYDNPRDVPVILATKERSARYVRVTAGRLWPRTNDYVFALAELIVLSNGKNVAAGATVTALDSIEAGRWSTKHLVDGFTSRTKLGDPHIYVAAAQKRHELESEIARLTAERRRLVEALVPPETQRMLTETSARLAEIDRQLAALPKPQLVYAAANQFAPQGQFTPAGGPRPIYFLNRGSDKLPGPEMVPGALSCLGALPADFALADPADEGSRRAALAQWIVDRRNPLTWRSIVNRVWQYHFGRGIVDTPNDFGHMGALPTHPELLDWLASEFIVPSSGGTVSTGGGRLKAGLQTADRQPESLKQLHRLILHSSAYRQSSAHHAGNAAIDASNQYLWRQNRQRLEAEALHDAVLFVSGRLDTTMGGPSDRQFFFKDDHSPVYDYERFDIDSPAANRRSVYRFIVRSVPDPFMECLDAADPSIVTPKRNTTLTALQALSLLNNQFMTRQAEHFAARLAAARDDLPQQIDLAYRLAFSRTPRDEERRVLMEYAAHHGLANTCRVILNSNEFLFVD